MAASALTGNDSIVAKDAACVFHGESPSDWAALSIGAGAPRSDLRFQDVEVADATAAETFV